MEAPEHAVIVTFVYGSVDLTALYELEDELAEVVADAKVGELDGHEIAVDGGDATLFLYGPDCDRLFASIRSALNAREFMRGATATLRRGAPGAEESNVVLEGPSAEGRPDYRVHRSTSELSSTGFVEIAPGKSKGTHWRDGNVFVAEEEFRMAAGIVAEHVHFLAFNVTEVPKSAGAEITRAWRAAAESLIQQRTDEALAVMHLAGARAHCRRQLEAHGAEIATMLIELADACDAFYEHDEWICIRDV